MTKKNNVSVAAKAFAEKWKDQGYEKGQTQQFWMELLQKVYGVSDPFSFIEFEGQVKNLSSTSFMDAYIAKTKVLIEQKSIKVDLGDGIRQSDGSVLTPFEQAKKYVVDMPVSKHPRWVVTCNFQEFRIYDMENPLGEPEIVALAELEKEYYRLQFLVDDTKELLKKEEEVSMAAGRIIGDIYEAFRAEYVNPDDPNTLRSLNILCVRLVFCLYAEDAGLFNTHTQFHDYMVKFRPETGEMRRALIDLFEILNTKEGNRDPYLLDDLKAFPYVNGGLFADKNIEIPRFNDKIANLLLKHGSEDFDWSLISPTIVGGIFESTLNPETRRKGGMHYTSIENIHKVIDPLFLDTLKAELADIKADPQEKRRIARAKEFQDKLAGLKFLDPACGSGNFLTETFISLRRLENEAIRIIYKGQMMMGAFVNPIKVSIGQMYGIEINDFAVSVAMTALWIAEAQMLAETEKIMQIDLDFLPLKSYTNIHEGNALRMDWNEVVPASELNYIMGNPPFIGARWMGKEQKDELVNLFGKEWPGVGDLDYVTCWYKIASDYIVNHSIRCALVSTNSITQGGAVANLWKPLMEAGIHIDFAWRTFIWDSEANMKAHVHCVIVGFSRVPNSTPKRIYDKDKVIPAKTINGYLLDAPSIFIEKRMHPICDVPEICLGSQPIDDGNLIMSEEEKDVLLKAEPQAEVFIRHYMMGKDFIQRKPRYCLWLKGANPSVLKTCHLILERVQKVREFRLASNRASTLKSANAPTLFGAPFECKGTYVAIPKVSSENREYVPMDYLEPEIIPGDKLFCMQGASLYDFGVMTSSAQMSWMRAVCGRLEMRYSYSNTIVYNNFPWPQPTDVQKAKIEATAQAILDARAFYPDSSLADLYDDLTMPVELRKAHRANDAAVMEAYGFRKDMTEPEIVAELFKMYQKLTK